MLNSTLFLSVANYSCNVWYGIVGDTGRECQANGTWSNFEPRCELLYLETIIGVSIAVTVTIILTVFLSIVLCALYCQKRKHYQLPTREEQTSVNSSVRYVETR